MLRINKLQVITWYDLNNLEKNYCVSFYFVKANNTVFVHKSDNLQ